MILVFGFVTPTPSIVKNILQFHSVFMYQVQWWVCNQDELSINYLV